MFSLQDDIKSTNTIVTVVDNCSEDDSIKTIEQAIIENHWANSVQLIKSPINGGFSAGNNLGIQGTKSDAYLLLNSDTILRPGAIKSLLEAMQANPDAGLISPRLEWSDETPQISCFRYHSPFSELIDAAASSPVTKLLAKYNVPIPVSDTPIKPQWTSFACVLIRHEVIEQIGLMDEGYFMYFDDVDYCRRARNAGWEILHYPQSRVVHLRGGSNSVKADLAARKRPKSYLYASRTRYFTKHYGSMGLWLANLCWLAGRSISLL
ncbi:MAG: glycosyltransferase family 2 protein, partial [Xenococcaceae cyanobacterium MO_188.B19]|nr:glycosyltransferase family 2 protein [Xenococcaceae cyanobacterium MO_188.B19]